MIRASGN